MQRHWVALYSHPWFFLEERFIKPRKACCFVLKWCRRREEYIDLRSNSRMKYVSSNGASSFNHYWKLDNTWKKAWLPAASLYFSRSTRVFLLKYDDVPVFCTPSPLSRKTSKGVFSTTKGAVRKTSELFLTPLRLTEIAMILRWTSCFCLMRVCAKSYLKTIVKSLVWLAHLSGPRCLLTWVLHFAQGINIEKENVESMPKTTKNTSPNGASYWSRLNFSDEDLILNFISSKFNLHLSFWSFFDLSSVV